MVAELVYSGKSVSEIAGYDDAQIHNVIFRKRDNKGAIIRKGGANDYPDHVKFDSNGMRVITNPCGFRDMYASVQKRRGLNKEVIEDKWKAFLTKREEQFSQFKQWIKDKKSKL
jgi:hypothetical protein